MSELALGALVGLVIGNIGGLWLGAWLAYRAARDTLRSECEVEFTAPYTVTQCEPQQRLGYTQGEVRR